SNAINSYKNPGGMMSPKSNWTKLIKYDTLEDGLNATAKTLNRITKKEKRTTLEAIGAVYAPVGAENDPNNLNQYWVESVKNNMEKLGGSTVCSEGSDWTTPAQGRLSSHFGYRTHPIHKVKKLHRGTDIANATGTRIVASKSGVVTEARSLGGYGNVVVITHNVKGKRMTTLYAHMSKIGVKKGDYVSQGQEIGKMGSTGNSTGPHLHFEVHNGNFSYNDNTVENPLKYV